MKLSVVQGNITQIAADTVVVNLFEGVTQPSGATGAVDKALGGAISRLIANGDLTGAEGQIRVLYPHNEVSAERIFIVGLGKREKFSPLTVLRISAAVAKQARKHKAQTVATIVHGAGIGGLAVEQAAQATVEGMALSLYHHQGQKHSKPPHEIAAITLVEADGDKIEAIRSGMVSAEAIVQGVTLARDLVNFPPNVCTPKFMAATAKKIAADHGLTITVGGRKWARKEKLGAFLAVAKGAGDPPRFIIMEHNAHLTEQPAIVLVGKGVTYDTGGITLKTSLRSIAMKADMAGAAAVLGTMETIARMKLPLRVIAITPCTENKPDADAYRPSDIITTGSGKTVEIISTDAEGRMILADALYYAQRYNPAIVIDLATLTGAVTVALGSGVAAGLFTKNDDLRDALIAAGATTHERLWPFPLYDDYRKKIDSTIADLKNSGLRGGGISSSAYFLYEFTDYVWAHLDIANMEFTTATQPLGSVGGTGFGVRLLTQFLRNRLN